MCERVLKEVSPSPQLSIYARDISRSPSRRSHRVPAQLEPIPRNGLINLPELFPDYIVVSPHRLLFRRLL